MKTWPREDVKERWMVDERHVNVESSPISDAKKAENMELTSLS